MKYFLFDIGHVLVDFDTEDFLHAAAGAAGRPVVPLSEGDLKKIEEVERGIISDSEFVEYLNQVRGLSWTVADLITVWRRMFRINETGRTLFLNAVKRDLPVYTLSNIACHHMLAIEKNWEGFFDGASGLFLSYQIGTRKPDPLIYRHALEQLGAQGKQCFFIDDRPENIEAAKSEGMDAHLFIPENHETIREAAGEFFSCSV
jgi:FMN phosphatase YigB (HAD superfamily)